MKHDLCFCSKTTSKILQRRLPYRVPWCAPSPKCNYTSAITVIDTPPSITFLLPSMFPFLNQVKGDCFSVFCCSNSPIVSTQFHLSLCVRCWRMTYKPHSQPAVWWCNCKATDTPVHVYKATFMLPAWSVLRFLFFYLFFGCLNPDKCEIWIWHTFVYGPREQMYIWYLVR